MIKLWLVLAFILSSCSVLAKDILEKDYAFPLHNPFEATITGTPPAYRETLINETEIKQADYHIRLYPEREFELPKTWWPFVRLTYRLAWQPKPAPLIFIIAGTGATYDVSKMEYLKKVFYKKGFHVVQISSPTSFDFMVAASRYATPGVTQIDAKDLYRVMQKIRLKLIDKDIEVTDYYLTGYSLGGLEAAFISYLDETRHSFNFKKVLLFNPPVNLYTSISNLDKMAEVQLDNVDDKTNFYEVLLKKATQYFQKRGHLELSEAVLYDFQHSKQKLTNEEMAMLIGSMFRLTAADIVFTSDLLNKRGLIVPADKHLFIATPLEPYLRKSLMCNFNCYLDEQVLPFWQKKQPTASLTSLIQQVSLYAIADYLKKTDKVYVMHNADDFILGKGDLAFLRRTLQNRLTIYPYGGHCGNMDYKENTQDMLEVFDD